MRTEMQPAADDCLTWAVGDVWFGRSERDEVFKFQIGFENVIAGWDLGVATMKKGERAAFR